MVNMMQRGNEKISCVRATPLFTKTNTLSKSRDEIFMRRRVVTPLVFGLQLCICIA
jgi:hypothetical protein